MYINKYITLFILYSGGGVTFAASLLPLLMSFFLSLSLSLPRNLSHSLSLSLSLSSARTAGDSPRLSLSLEWSCKVTLAAQKGSPIYHTVPGGASGSGSACGCGTGSFERARITGVTMAVEASSKGCTLEEGGRCGCQRFWARGRRWALALLSNRPVVRET